MNITTEMIYNTFKNNKNNVFVKTMRDLTLIRITENHHMVVAVDSDGGIGPQEGDSVKIPAYILGRFSIRVPLLEVLAAGAAPVCAFDMLTVPMNEIGKEIIRGVKDELTAAGLGKDFPISGSTEDNVHTNTTGIGTTIIGMVGDNELRPGKTESGDFLISIGMPKVGEEVNLDNLEILSQESFRIVLKHEGIHDILPVGSHGIKYEADNMAVSASKEIIFNEKQQLELEKSAGPSTCVIASCNKNCIESLQNKIDTPIFLIGVFK